MDTLSMMYMLKIFLQQIWLQWKKCWATELVFIKNNFQQDRRDVKDSVPGQLIDRHRSERRNNCMW